MLRIKEYSWLGWRVPNLQCFATLTGISLVHKMPRIATIRSWPNLKEDEVSCCLAKKPNTGFLNNWHVEV
jgi:hypothetical protein